MGKIKTIDEQAQQCTYIPYYCASPAWEEQCLKSKWHATKNNRERETIDNFNVIAYFTRSSKLTAGIVTKGIGPCSRTERSFYLLKIVLVSSKPWKQAGLRT